MEKTATKKSKTMLAPDYAPVERVLLICPEGVHEDGDYSHLAFFYDQLIRLVPMNVQVICLVREKVRLNGLISMSSL
jgi:hypothetical protein